MIKIYQKTVKELRVRSVKRIKVGSWVHVVSPDEQEIGQLVNELNLEEGLVRDALDLHEVPRLEVKKKIVYIFTRFPVRNKGNITTVPILIAVGEDFVTTITRTETPFVERLTKTKKHRKLPIDFSTTQKTKLVSLFLYEINKQYDQYILEIQRNIQRSQVRLENITNKDVMRLVAYENTLNDFLNALLPTNNFFQTLMQGKVLELFERDKDFMEDIFLSNNQIVEKCKSSLKNIINTRGAYSTIMTNNLNRVIHLLTGITIILTVPTIISSMYGMNVPLPFSHSPIAFLGILGTTFLVSLILLLVLKRNKWL